ncbi:Importin alpha re-exporter [Ceratocystis fimbriata CBS 114723]|uniref:Importin alpha re-exporter n=2 Tax=Ceratocystis TaxID=5157 RepID=A0A0F8BN42_CERFI|nr:Importin alpha re-exporter [Ceratocystis platani]PHH53613.1 Importin alpha re-exporter [Ceratocystis fimbriata CBS 114723]
MSAELGVIAQLLDATLDPAQHRKAESALKDEQKKPQYSLTLLKIVASDSLPTKTRLAASLAFKNFIRSNYVDEDGNYKLTSDEVTTIKQELIGLMITCPAAIQSQLGEAISIIADSDFWERWDTLTSDLVSRFSATDPKVNVGVLEVAHSIFQRWRPLFQSDELYKEINHVISTFGQPFVKLLITTNNQIDTNQNNKAALKGWFDTLSLLIKILYDMSSHDIPPIFEENLGDICGLLAKYLKYSNPVLETDDDDEASIVDVVKSDICEVLELYTLKYGEDFMQYCPPFVETVWNLLSNVGPETKYDGIASKALHFLTAVAGTREQSDNFNSEPVLSQIVEKVILPNLALRESDMEMFEDEPIEFIRRDLEGSDTDSRRRSATDFLKKLMERFEDLVTGVVSRYINHYLEQGKTDWKAKDTAIYLFISIASQGAVTASHGIKSVNSKVNVVDFFQQHIAQDLVSEGGEPIAKVDAIKYLYTFRSQLSKEQWKGAFPPLIKCIGSSNYIIYTYAAIAVERLLFLTDNEGQHVLTRDDIEAFSSDLLDHLFKLIEHDPSPPKLQENEFLMRCVMRILIVLQDKHIPVLPMVLNHLVGIMQIMKQNPSNPRFYYYSFEALGALVRYGAATQSQLLNEKLWAPINEVFVEDVAEFVPYVLQILAQLLESSPANSISDNYRMLIDPILNQSMWEVRGNVPALARLLTALIPRVSKDLLTGDKLTPVLGIFQMLLSRKKTELYAFDIIESIVVSFDPADLDAYFSTVLQLLFSKLQSAADSFKLRFVRFYHLVSARLEQGYGADYFISQSEKLQAGIFTQIYPAIILPETPKLARPVDRKLAVVSMSKTLCNSTAFATKFLKGWARTCMTMLDLVANAPTVVTGLGDELITGADVDDIGFGVGFTALNTCKPVVHDDFAEISDIKVWISAYLRDANSKSSGTVAQFAESRLEGDAQAAMRQLMA